MQIALHISIKEMNSKFHNLFFQLLVNKSFANSK